MKFDQNWWKFKLELLAFDRAHPHTLIHTHTLTHSHTHTHSREYADVHTHNFTQKQRKFGFLTQTSIFFCGVLAWTY